MARAAHNVRFFVKRFIVTLEKDRATMFFEKGVPKEIVDFEWGEAEAQVALMGAKRSARAILSLTRQGH